MDLDQSDLTIVDCRGGAISIRKPVRASGNFPNPTLIYPNYKWSFLLIRMFRESDCSGDGKSFNGLTLYVP